MNARTCLSLMLAVAGSLAMADETTDGINRLKSFTDDICTVTNIRFSTSYSTTASYVSGYETEIDSELGEVTAGHVVVDFVIRPEASSDIRCQLDLPIAATWDGRLWGYGNSGYAGKLPSDTATFASTGTAVMTTELGTWAYTDDGVRNCKVWPDSVVQDYCWRATHLMTVYGKRLAELFYGRKPDHCYFYGGSCGGRQAMGEVTRFPDDYDSVIANLPHCNGVATEAAIMNRYLQTRNASGSLLPGFTDANFLTIANLAVEYFSANGSEWDRHYPFVGNFLADGRVSAEAITNFVEYVATKLPAFASDDMKARLRAIHLPVYHNGKMLFQGFNPGTYHKNFGTISIVGLKNYLIRKGVIYYDNGVERLRRLPNWDDFEEFVDFYGDTLNVNSPEISRYLAGGRKLIMITAWEDQTVPAGPIVECYEGICRVNGGYDAVTNAVRLFCCPGVSHGGGQGHLNSASNARKTVCAQLADWFEKGVAPDFITVSKASTSLSPYPESTLKVAVYPGLYYKDNAADDWRLTTLARSPIVLDDRYVHSDPKVMNCKRKATDFEGATVGAAAISVPNWEGDAKVASLVAVAGAKGLPLPGSGHEKALLVGQSGVRNGSTYLVDANRQIDCMVAVKRGERDFGDGECEGARFAIGWSAEGKPLVYTAGGVVKVDDTVYADGAWVRVSIAFDAKKQNATLWLDGVKKGEYPLVSGKGTISAMDALGDGTALEDVVWTSGDNARFPGGFGLLSPMVIFMK